MTFFLFLVIDQVFRILPLFSLIFRIFTLLDIVHSPFLTRKTPFFNSFHTFAHIRQHYFSKYWKGDECMGCPPPQTLGGPSPQPPRFPPLMTLFCLRLWRPAHLRPRASTSSLCRLHRRRPFVRLLKTFT